MHNAEMKVKVHDSTLFGYWKLSTVSEAINNSSFQNLIVRARTPAFGLIGIRMVIMVYGCKRGLE